MAKRAKRAPATRGAARSTARGAARTATGPTARGVPRAATRGAARAAAPDASSAIEIRHLRYFLAVAMTENFTRAAERLRVSQPNVSLQIKGLEQALRTPLFRRLGKRVRLTEAGAEFRRHAESVLRKLDEGCESVGRIAELLVGHVEVGVIPAVHLAWIPPVLAALAREFPGVTVSVHQRPSSEVETELEAGRFDLGLGIMSGMSPNLRYDRLLAERLALLVPPGHALAGRRSVRVQDLDGVRLVLLPESFDMRHLVDAIFHGAKRRPNVAFETGTIDAAMHTVLRAGTPTLLPPIVLKGRETLGLRAVQIAGGPQPVAFGLLTPRDTVPSPAARAFIELLERTIGEGALSVSGRGARRSGRSGRSPSA
jgi:LysR family transcriptional regulator, cyn operon transcriptional activator